MASRLVQRVLAWFLPGEYYPPGLSFILEARWRRLVFTPEVHADRLHLDPHARVLDVGSGPGYLSVAAARRAPYGTIVALDVQQAMLERVPR